MRYSPPKLLLLFISLALLNNCKRWDTDITTISEMDECIQNEMEKQDIPAVAALIFKDDNIVYESYFGQANIEDGIALDSNAVFLMASVSKTVTATALLQLYQIGAFQLDDPINDYLNFDVSIPGYTEAVTFRHLLTHTSGIADGSALDSQYYYGEDSPTDLATFLESYLTPGGQYYNESENFHDFAPGAQHEYSNVGSALIGVLVEEISGNDFNTYCQQNIFTPLRMEHTFWRLDEVDQPLVMPYTYASREFSPTGHYTFTDYPNGGLRSNARDMFRFFRAFVAEGVSNGVTMLHSTTVDEMLQPQIPDLDETVGLHMFEMDKDLNLWGHDGGEQGVSTVAAFNIDSKVGVILLANMSDVNLDPMMKAAYNLGSQF